MIPFWLDWTALVGSAVGKGKEVEVGFDGGSEVVDCWMLWSEWEF